MILSPNIGGPFFSVSIYIAVSVADNNFNISLN